MSILISASAVRAQDSVPPELEAKAEKIQAAIDKIVSTLQTQTSVSAANPRKIAVSALVSLGPTARDKQMGDVVAEILQEKLAKVDGVTLIERMQLAKILEELKLSLLGLTDPGNAEAVGKMAGADAMIVGSVSEVAADFRISIRLVNVETGKIEKALAVSVPQENMIALSSDYVVVRTRSDAIFRSLLIPGWGQLYNRAPVRGGVYLTLTAAAGGGAVAAFMLAEKSKEAYEAIKEPDQTKLDAKAEEYSTRRKWANGLGFAAAGIWVINIIDAAATGQASTEVKSAPALSLAPADSGAGMQVAWRF